MIRAADMIAPKYLLPLDGMGPPWFIEKSGLMNYWPDVWKDVGEKLVVNLTEHKQA